jgi:hypothetical protein
MTPEASSDGVRAHESAAMSYTSRYESEPLTAPPAKPPRHTYTRPSRASASEPGLQVSGAAAVGAASQRLVPGS